MINFNFIRLSSSKILILILIFSTLIRLYRLDFPNKYVFDEVYHAYTAKEYLKGNREAWSPWGKSEPGVAFEWLHPPISKEFMTASMFIAHSTDAWAWRLPGALLGILSVYLVYILAKSLFRDEKIALLSTFMFSIEGLVFVQSRTGMNDAYLVTFILASAIFFIRKNFLLSAVFLGIACSTKWPGIYLIGLFFPFLIYQKRFKEIFYFIFIPPLIYFLSYTHYFLQGYTFNDFIELHKQIWWYQTNLKATHDYASPWWSWPFNLFPVWYFVDYENNQVANIFASGNPVLFWVGSLSIILTGWQAIKHKSAGLMFIVLGFLVFWLPWSISPRIMFLYHFSPSVPFLALSLGYQLSQGLRDEKNKRLSIVLIMLIVLSFIMIFPFLTGIHLPSAMIDVFFKTNLSKNPF